MIETVYGPVAEDFFEALRKVKVVVFDVDGTLTPGEIFLDNKDNELKRFSVKDGYGIANLHKAEVKAGIITGRTSELVARRAKELNMQFCYQGVKDKRASMLRLMQEHDLQQDEVTCMGDDLNDFPMFDAIDPLLVTCPADATFMVKKRASYITRAEGGKGAARELCDLIMMSRGIYPLK